MRLIVRDPLWPRRSIPCALGAPGSLRAVDRRIGQSDCDWSLSLPAGLLSLDMACRWPDYARPAPEVSVEVLGSLHAVKAPDAIACTAMDSDRRCPSSALDLSCTPHKPCVLHAVQPVPCANFGHCAGTAIPPCKRRIPFDLRSKARSGPVSTEVGDDSGILRCRSFCSAQLCWLPVLRLCTPSLT